ncbi:alpha/beta hydrolase [Streptomyces sp. NBC_00885]|uniref:alpha/beta fold hydrolase n=1 Tax=Streptomyces sp. NBC_00885 TaxID=2975857 RepID=UPI003863F56F|nr:alpha/beta hydrolase [Streptomyces sp. NBC_00885]
MTRYVLIPGADGRAWYWHLVVPELRARGHDVVTVDLPQEESAGLAEYTDAVVRAIGAPAGGELVLVAQSLGGFIAPLVCERIAVDGLILVNPMVPAPGESAGDWWANTGQAKARATFAVQEGRSPDAAFDMLTDFFHDVPQEVTVEAMTQGEAGPTVAVFTQPWPLGSWPDVPTRCIQGREDRFFPLDFQRRVVRERLGIAVEEMPGGHLLALSRPAELAELICR